MLNSTCAAMIVGCPKLSLMPNTDSRTSNPVAKRTSVERAMTISGTMMLM
jgi:hypothetical protein